MRHQYIKIDSITEIDTSRISLATIENRYIDTQGRRYATRFNLRARKIEVVPIALGREEAAFVKRLVVNPRSNATTETIGDDRPQNRIHPNPMKIPPWISELNAEPNLSDSELHSFLLQAEREMQRNGERYRGLIQSLKMSSVLEDMKDGNQHDAILELSNTFERDIQSHAARVQTMVVEFLRFPKPLASYLGQIDRNCKKYVEKLDLDKQKRYCQAYLLAGEMFGVFKGCQELIAMITKFTSEAKPDKLNYDRKGAFESAMESLDYLKNSLDAEIAAFLGVLTAADVI